jgi:hypothetical protein
MRRAGRVRRSVIGIACECPAPRPPLAMALSALSQQRFSAGGVRNGCFHKRKRFFVRFSKR